MALIGHSHERSRQLFAEAARTQERSPKTFEGVALIDHMLQLYEGLRIEMVMVRATLDAVIAGLTNAGLVATSRRCELCGQSFTPVSYGKRIFEARFCPRCRQERATERSAAHPGKQKARQKYEIKRKARKIAARAARVEGLKL